MMQLQQLKIGMCFTGSFCSYETVFQQLENLCNLGATITPIFSFHAQKIDSRFGKASFFLKKAAELTKQEPITSIPGAEIIGPKRLFDLLLIAPCTGNTMAKLANGITDSPVLMACKAHLRNRLPLVISLASNDALGMNLKNIGILLNTKDIYFVPFGQDNPSAKPNSMIAQVTLLVPTIEQALKGIQIQPLLQSFPMER